MAFTTSNRGFCFLLVLAFTTFCILPAGHADITSDVSVPPNVSSVRPPEFFLHYSNGSYIHPPLTHSCSKSSCFPSMLLGKLGLLMALTCSSLRYSKWVTFPCFLRELLSANSIVMQAIPLMLALSQ
ncbi:hypothetical protein FH972_010566 [Carpinus fangiana]|uniref:Transmembrane protein n=1 Tax=Carpinus fangiana TaxID=176857 RepID=A0A660KRH0_9ROSI|nr:hypothetical protein FH972_010566 [Carpinus fangiana]